MNNKIISDLRGILIQSHRLDFILRVGMEREQNDENKIDLLAGYCEGDAERYLYQIKTSLEDQWPDAKLSISDDAVRFELGTISCGIAACNSARLVEQIKEWIEGKNLAGQHRSWAVGYWLPEALFGDLATAEVLHDAKDAYREIRNLVVPYSECLSQAIATVCVNEIRQKLDTLGHLSQKSRVIEFTLCLSGISAAVIRLAFARSRRYLRGFRSLAEQVTFLQPPDFALYELASQLLYEQGATHVLEDIRIQL